MPFTGGYSPSPERTGGGSASSPATLIQRVFESIARARGQAITQSPQSVAGAENLALARAIALDLFGGNQRLANELHPATATVDGLLPRWETIFARPPLPGDSQPVRQARVAAAWAAFGRPGILQVVVDQLKALLGPVYVGISLRQPNIDAISWWPGVGGTTGYVSAVSGNQVTVSGLPSQPAVWPNGVPNSAPGSLVTLGNAATAANAGTFLVQSYSQISSNTCAVVCINNGAPSSPDYGVGGSSGSPTLHWSFFDPRAPWATSVRHLLVQLTYQVTGYQTPSGTPNAAFYALAAQVGPVLDAILPADMTWDWYCNDSSGSMGFKLDEVNLSVEAFGS